MMRFFVIVSLLIAGIGGYYRRWLQAQTVRASMESHVVQTALGQVEYDMRGCGPVVLHFHGSTGGHNSWFLLKHLVEAGYRVLTPDRPGYLGTPLSDNGSPKAQADLAAALLDTLGINQVAVVAISGGGTPALEFALRYPQRTRALVLICAVTKRTSVSDNFLSTNVGRLMLSPRFQNPAYFLVHQMTKLMPSLVLHDFARGETTYDKETRQQYIRRLLNDPDQRQMFMDLADTMVPARPRFAGIVNDIDVQQNLGKLPLDQIHTPTLIIHSPYDGDVPYENATHAHSHIPNSELITVNQFGHMVWAGDPQVTSDFQARMENFFLEHLGPQHR